jgi:hypothetical protein
LKVLGVLLVEKLNDQYLSNTGFYRFISQLLELHDSTEPLLLRKTRAWVYWTMRLGLAPVRDSMKVWRRIWRAKRLSKRLRRGEVAPAA